ncbi:hypothetical protein EW026_g2221 [Hermanssonia centrifuga]|uniref:DUF6535 domain-containing protein n=1 Tax=Hermanssonia centrifuga TaxID=98765 RepID=A0A4S4KPY3_9APHY|nr:hypothetical protein EW026_g2221 [Hermanssonia centrifuga]
MAKTLRDVDEEKIEDTKEDIDTLLVFAGLFAAVLTPFLAETYQTLSEDPGDTSVAIQRHMSAQSSSYVMMNGFLNSTVPAYPSDAPSFVPPPFALSINVLWFASLTLAVVTASFGILVKQWLREYMFRVTALDDWKVFDIAAILPLLLQFSLGLFFVGLCFFSWSVHPTIGRTVTSIVSCWGSFFFFAIIAPACSARCPYKTALLKKAMRVLRRCICGYYITRHIYLGPVKESGAAVEDEDAAGDAKGDVQILTAADAILLDDDLLVTTMSDSLEDIQSSIGQVEVIDFVIAALQQRLPASGLIARPIEFLDLSRLPERTRSTLVKITSQTVKRGLDLRSKPVNDLEEWAQDAIMILLTSYSPTFPPYVVEALTLCMTTAFAPTCHFIRDKQLAFTMMSDASSAVPMEIIYTVVVAALQQTQYLPASGPITRPVVSLDLSHLPEREWTALVKLVSQTLKCRPVLRINSSGDFEGWAQDAITILSAFYPSTFIPEAGDALTLCMTTALIPTCQLIGSAQNLLIGHTSRDSDRSEGIDPRQWLSHMLELLRGLFSRSDITLPVKDILQSIFGLVLAIPDLCGNSCAHDQDQHDLKELLSSHADHVPNSTIGGILVEYRSRLSTSEREADPQYIDLVIAADAALDNDTFLRDVLQEAVQRYQAMPSELMKFIIRIIRNRQKQSILSGHLQFDDISQTTIMGVIARLLNATLDSPRYSDASYTDWELWMKDAVLVLLSISEHLMTEEICRTLVRWCTGTSSTEDRQSVIHHLLSLSGGLQITEYEGYRGVFERVHSASSPPMLFRMEETTSGAVNYIQSSVCNGACVHGSGLGEMYIAHEDQGLVFSRVADFLMASATAVKTCLGETSLSGLDDLLVAIFSADPSREIKEQQVHIAISASSCAMADTHVLDSTYVDAIGRYRLLDTIDDVFGQRSQQFFDEDFPMVAVFNVAFLHLHLMCLQISANIDLAERDTRMWSRSLSNLVDELKNFQTLRIPLEQDNDSIVAAAGKCLELLGSHPDRSAIETFINNLNLHSRWHESKPELRDLLHGLKAFVPEDKVSQYPILDALPEEEHIQDLIPG